MRNLVRPLDIAATWAFLFAPPGGRRLGDKIAGTFVVTRRRSGPSKYAGALVAGWERRTQAALIDGVLIVLLAGAYLAAAGCIAIRGGVEIELRGYPVVVLIILIFLYYVIPEGRWGATPGKALTGLRVVYRSHAKCDTVAATWRTLLRPLDMVPLGVPAFVSMKLTRMHQRLGDLAAGTLVVIVSK